jgi:hypothetical protein
MSNPFIIRIYHTPYRIERQEQFSSKYTERGLLVLKNKFEGEDKKALFTTPAKYYVVNGRCCLAAGYMSPL